MQGPRREDIVKLAGRVEESNALPAVPRLPYAYREGVSLLALVHVPAQIRNGSYEVIHALVLGQALELLHSQRFEAWGVHTPIPQRPRRPTFVKYVFQQGRLPFDVVASSVRL